MPEYDNKDLARETGKQIVNGFVKTGKFVGERLAYIIGTAVYVSFSLHAIPTAIRLHREIREAKRPGEYTPTYHYDILTELGAMFASVAVLGGEIYFDFKHPWGVAVPIVTNIGSGLYEAVRSAKKNLEDNNLDDRL